MTTTNENKISILADLWMDYRDDVEFADFIEYNDLSLPLAYAIDNDIVKVSDKSMAFIDESFLLLLTGLGIAEDTGFEGIEDLLEQAEQ
jgi:hypothetical protein